MSETVLLSHGLPSSIREGEVLGGKYRLEKEIGRGAMGTVWSAVHLTLGQRVAIKLISAEHAQSREARARFSTEAKAAARLRSRYVVQVYDDGETQAGTPYIVLEYLDGETLEQRMEREHDLPLNDAVRITRHVARALSRAHAQGIVHRDLKPGNVFLTRSDDDELGWVAKVLDFGIAKVEEHGIASTTKTGTLLGTPLFMSPEQVRGASSVDSRSDLYSLGMVFYNMMTGNLAFNGESFADVLVAICTGPLPDIRETAPWIPASVADWFRRACAREPHDRFQSADEMVEALDLALGVSSGAVSRQSQGELKIDTLRGHAPPVAHGVPRAAADDSGQYAKGSTQVLTTDPTLLGSNHVTASRTVNPALVVPTTSRTPLLVGASVLALLLIGGAALVLGRGKASEPSAALASGMSSSNVNHAAEAIPAPAAPSVTATQIMPPASATAASAPLATSTATTTATAEPVVSSAPSAPVAPARGATTPSEPAKFAAASRPARAPANPPKTASNTAENKPAPSAPPARNAGTDIGF